MRRAVLFLSRFILGLWIVIVGAFLFLLLSNSPFVPDVPFDSVSINAEPIATVHLPNRIFTCTETEQQFQCQAEIQERSLDLSWEKGNEYQYDLENCRAWYDGQSVGCEDRETILAMRLFNSYEVTDLGWSPQQLQAVQQEYQVINALVELGEPLLLLIGTGLALVAGISVACLAWLKPGSLSKGFASFACGWGMYLLVWGFLGSVWYEVVTPYGFTFDTWDLFTNGGAIAAGIVTTLIIALRLWQRFNRFTKILASISSGIAVFTLCELVIALNFSHLSDFFNLLGIWSQQGDLLIWAVSAVFAIAAAILLWLHTRQSIKKYLCLVSGFGATALVSYYSLYILLSLGYAD